MTKKHECCFHGNDDELGKFCCKCELGVKRGPSFHDERFFCHVCSEIHPGSRLLDGCPNWLDNMSKMGMDAQEMNEIIKLDRAVRKKLRDEPLTSEPG